jgi:competence protein ComEC
MRLAALVAFIAGVCLLQSQAWLPSVVVAALLLAAGTAALITHFAARALTGSARVALLVGGAAVAGYAYAALHAQARLADALPFEDEGKDITLVGTVVSLPMRVERGLRFEFEVDTVQTPGVTVPRRLLLGWYAPAVTMQPGERWQMTVGLKRPHGVLNPGGFDLEAWLLERDLRATGAVRGGRRHDPPLRLQPIVWRADVIVERARSALRDRLHPLLDGYRYSGVVLALVIGDQRAIAARDWTVFNRTGIAHLVSISGLHITMIAGLAALVVGAVWRRVPALVRRAPAQTIAVIAGLVAACGYALLSGWGVPAQRTVLMLAVVAVAWLAQSRIGQATALALAAAVVCLVDPWAVLSAGFWLSFGAVAAIVWVMQGRWRDPQRPLWRSILVAAIRVQIAVTLALIPATVLLFHQLSLVSPIANALAIPVVSWIVTPLALFGAVLALLPAPLAALGAGALAAAHAVFALLAQALEGLSTLSWAAWPIAGAPLPMVLLAVAGVALLLAPPGWPARWAGTAALLPLLFWPPERPQADELWVSALDVGQGSAVLVETHDRNWLYDTGPRYSSDTDAGERVILPYLRQRGIGRLDGIVVSHLDSDHAGGAAAVLRGVANGRIVSSIGAGHEALAKMLHVERCEAGQQWEDGPLRFTVLHPAAGDYGRRRSTNAMSCVLLVAFGTQRLLLTGDVGADDEAAIIARWPAVALRWMAAPHHGSRSSSSPAFLQWASPAIAVVQAGYRNSYGHPDHSVIGRYEAIGSAVLRTDQSGFLQWRFRVDGSVQVGAWRTLGARYWHNQPAAPLSPPSVEDEDSTEIAPPEPLIAG